jgi:hypothetical protein
VPALRRTLILVGMALAVVLVVVVVGETADVVGLARDVHPVVGTVTLWVLLAVYAAIVIVPIVTWVRLPPRLDPPVTDAGPEFDEHLAVLATRLRMDRPSSGGTVERADVERALTGLGERADALIVEAAKRVFLSTAISQSGRLDGLTVLWLNARLVKDVASIYYQRPILRDLASLYGNVASTALLSTELDDADIAEQVEPIITSVLGTAVAAVPGMQAATNLLVNSVLTGSANAFLTLRIGMLAKLYTAPLVRPERRKTRRSATAMASRLLGSVVADGTRRVVGAVGRAARGKATGWLRRDPAGVEADLIEDVERRSWWERIGASREQRRGQGSGAETPSVPEADAE